MSTGLVIVGLGPGNPDELSIGALRCLKEANSNGTSIYLRTRVHPTVTWLEESEKIVFNGSFDRLYETLPDFDSVYNEIARFLIERVAVEQAVVYAVPGHPLVGETSVAVAIKSARSRDLPLKIVSSTSFIEPVLAAAGHETSAFHLVDAHQVPDSVSLFRWHRSPFDTTISNIVYQVHDRDMASRVKLALLEQYPPDTKVVVVSGGGVPAATRSAEIEIARLDRGTLTFDHLTTLIVPPIGNKPEPETFDALLDIMAQLRNPDTGCPWDKEQTPQSLRRFLIEEAYEVLEAIEDDDPDKYCEELGDLVLQVVFHAQLARERAEFDIRDVINSISEKLIRRHPHVFGDVEVNGTEDVLRNWEIIKKQEKGYETRKSVLDGVPRGLPALMKAQEISKRATRAGFEWGDLEGVFDKVEEEIGELKFAVSNGDIAEIESEIGDLFFTLVNVARYLKLDSETALEKMVKRFQLRFRAMESAADKALSELNAEEWDRLWKAAKREESERTQAHLAAPK